MIDENNLVQEFLIKMFNILLFDAVKCNDKNRALPIVRERIRAVQAGESKTFLIIVCDLSLKTQTGALVVDQVIEAFKEAHLPVPFMCVCTADQRK